MCKISSQLDNGKLVKYRLQNCVSYVKCKEVKKGKLGKIIRRVTYGSEQDGFLKKFSFVYNKL